MNLYFPVCCVVKISKIISKHAKPQTQGFLKCVTIPLHKFSQASVNNKEDSGQKLKNRGRCSLKVVFNARHGLQKSRHYPWLLRVVCCSCLAETFVSTGSMQHPMLMVHWRVLSLYRDGDRLLKLLTFLKGVLKCMHDTVFPNGKRSAIVVLNRFHQLC